ncbi:hypothetical protein V8E36_005263 [Tilletia maclaganii]
MKIIPVPVRDETMSTSGVFVDTYELSKVQTAAREHGVEDIVGCITTHHHHDHSGGNTDFANAYPDAPIYGGSNQVVSWTHPVSHGSTFPLFPGSSVKGRCHATPCHTQDSIAYFLEDESVHRFKQAGERAPYSGPRRSFKSCDSIRDPATNSTSSSQASLDAELVICVLNPPSSSGGGGTTSSSSSSSSSMSTTRSTTTRTTTSTTSLTVITTTGPSGPQTITNIITVASSSTAPPSDSSEDD